MAHKISEWEDKRPFNVEYLGFGMENREVVKVVAYETVNFTLLTYDRKGNAYSVFSPSECRVMRYDPDERKLLSFYDALMLMPMPKEEYNIRW